jgi:hypothetical protein
MQVLQKECKQGRTIVASSIVDKHIGHSTSFLINSEDLSNFFGFSSMLRDSMAVTKLISAYFGHSDFLWNQASFSSALGDNLVNVVCLKVHR